MNSERLEARREVHVNDLYACLPSSLGFQIKQHGEGVWTIDSNACSLRVSFERYDDRNAVVEFSKVDCDSAYCRMSFWLMRHLRGATAETQHLQRPFQVLGSLLVRFFPDILSGDFSFRAEYDKYENRILAQMFAVTKLPFDHPTRVRYENYDLRWLTEMEDGTWRTLQAAH